MLLLVTASFFFTKNVINPPRVVANPAKNVISNGIFQFIIMLFIPVLILNAV